MIHISKQLRPWQQNNNNNYNAYMLDELERTFTKHDVMSLEIIKAEILT